MKTCDPQVDDRLSSLDSCHTTWRYRCHNEYAVFLRAICVHWRLVRGINLSTICLNERRLKR